MQGSLIYIVMPVVIVPALFVLIALPFAGARGSGGSRSRGMHSRGPESQNRIPAHSVAPDVFGSEVTGLNRAQHLVTAHAHVPGGAAAPSSLPARDENTRKVTS